MQESEVAAGGIEKRREDSESFWGRHLHRQFAILNR